MSVCNWTDSVSSMFSESTVSVGFSFVPVTVTTSVAGSESTVPSFAVIASSAVIVSPSASWRPL